MLFDRFEVRISLQKLLIGLVLVIVPLSVLGLYVTAQGDSRLQQTIGTHFKVIAQAKGDQVAQFLNERVLACATLAAAQAVHDGIVASNKTYRGLGDAEIQDKAGKIASVWNSPQGSEVARTVLSSAASQFLRRRRDLDPRFLRITVSDEHAAAVAASDKPTVYLQSEEAYWQHIYEGARASVYVGDVRYDDVSKSTYVGIAVPVIEEGSGSLIGAVYSLIDVSALFALFNDVQIGPGANAILTKDDGSVIASQNAILSMNLKSEEYAAVRGAMGSLQGRQTGFIVASMRGGSRSIVGFADAGLKQNYRNLGWIVVVSQEEREATAAIRGIGSFALLMVCLAGLMLTLTTVYFFLHRRQQFEDIEALHGVDAPQVPLSK